MFGESTSESPRLPSPWDSRLLTPTGSKTPLTHAATSHQHQHQHQHHSLIPEEDLSGHIEYKLRLPAHPSVDRLARLTSQLKWRLLEGGGEAIYELGVCDNGLLLGIDIDEIQYSLATLERMADGLGASVKVVRRMQVSSDGIQELPLDDAPSIPWPSSVKEEPPIPLQPKDAVPSDTAIEASAADVPPPFYINKRRLSKKDRRQVKRDRDIWLESREKQQTIAGEGQQDEAGFLTFEDEQDGKNTELDSSIASSTSTPAYISVTPPADEIPQLSHSPSPPSSNSGSQQYAIQHSSIAHVTVNEHMYSASTSSTLTANMLRSASADRPSKPKPIPLEYNEAEQAQCALRRHLRKQWKKEKQHAKQLERSRQMACSHPSRQPSSRHGLPYHFALNDKYLDGLVVLFDDVVLGTETAEEPSLNAVTAVPGVMREQASSTCDAAKARRRHRRRGPAFSPTSTPLSGNLTPAIAMKIAAPPATVITDQQKQQPIVKTWRSSRHPGPVSKSAIGAPRYAVECIVKMPSAATSRVESDDDDEAELAMFGSEATEHDKPTQITNSIPIPFPSNNADINTTLAAKNAKAARKASRPARERTRLRSFIDFETVWDELEMDL